MHVLYVGSDTKRAQQVVHTLKCGFCAIDTVTSIDHAVIRIERIADAYDILILDSSDAEEAAERICATIRRLDQQIYIVVLSSLPTPNQAATLLLTHADEFITLPVTPAELFARLTALHRRSSPRAANTLTCGALYVYPESKVAYLHDERLQLSRIEYLIIELLLQQSPKLVPRETITNHIWEVPEATASNTIDVHIRNIRRKLNGERHLLKTVRGFGYRISL